MARNIVYHMSEAYNLGYDDGFKDAKDMACEAYCNSICNAEKPCNNKCGGYNRFVRELEGKV